MTDRLYYRDAYLTRFDARVVERSADGHHVYLDRSAFYPTSGGQPHDLGTLNGIAIEDVIDEEDRVVHVVAQPVSEDAVHGEIDWPRRFDFMQQHTGQHLISAIFADAFQRGTVSVHFGVESSTLDLDGGLLDERALREAEGQANQIVLENRPVTVGFEDAATVSGLRKPTTREATIRVVSIDGVDRSACGGTHVTRTAEIGPVLLRRQEKVRQGTRIGFVCGFRALSRAHRDFAILSETAQHLSASLDDAPALVASQADQLRDAQNRLRRVEGELQAYRARERYERAEPDVNGVRRVVERAREGTPDEWRAFAIAFCELPKAVFAAVTQNPPAILLAASSDAGVDAGRVLKAAVTSSGGRGGGSPRMAQGSVPSADALAAVLRELGLPAS